MYKLLQVPLPQDAQDHTILWWIFGIIFLLLVFLAGIFLGKLYIDILNVVEDYKLRMHQKEQIKKEDERENKEFEDLKRDVKLIKELYVKLETDVRHILTQFQTMNQNLPTMQTKLFEMLEKTQEMFNKANHESR